MIEPLKLFDVTVGWYPVMAMAAATAAGLFCVLYSPRHQVFPSRWTALLYTACIVFIGVIGARVWSVAGYTWTSDNFGSIAAFYEMLSPWETFARGGLIWYGGFLPVVVWLISLRWTCIRGQRFWQLLDVTALMGCLAYPIARTGCFLAGCCYGKWSDLPWAVYIRYGSEFSFVPRHPTNLYEAGLHAMLFGVLLRVDAKKPTPGATGLIFVVGHAVIRFFMEFIRTHSVTSYGLTSRQFISIALVVLAAVVLRWRIRSTRTEAPGHPFSGAPGLNLRMAASAVTVLAIAVTTFVSIDIFAMQPRQRETGLTTGMLQNLDGEAATLESFGGGPVVLNFWATWCAPCREEVPDLVEFSRSQEDVPVLGIASGESAELLRRSARELGISYPILLAEDRMLERFGVVALPRTVVLDGDGNISGVHSGPITLEELADLVAKAQS